MKILKIKLPCINLIFLAIINFKNTEILMVTHIVITKEVAQLICSTQTIKK